MALFGKKTPMAKWRSRNRVAAAFADHSRWDVHLASGAVHTTIDGMAVTVLAHQAANHQIGAIIEAGRQAERTLANDIGDDGGDPFEFEGWPGTAAPGSGLIEAFDNGGPDFYDQLMAAAHDLVTRVRCA